MPAYGIRILIANSCTRCRWIFKRLSQDGGWADFSKNLHVSLFKYPSNEPNFSRIHLAGQYFKSLLPISVIAFCNKFIQFSPTIAIGWCVFSSVRIIGRHGTEYCVVTRPISLEVPLVIWPEHWFSGSYVNPRKLTKVEYHCYKIHQRFFSNFLHSIIVNSMCIMDILQYIENSHAHIFYIEIFSRDQT